MTSKIFRSILLATVVVLLCSFSVILCVVYNYFDKMQIDQLKDELSLAAVGTEQDGVTYLKSVEPDRFRLTWISPEGVVLYDTQEKQEVMENHGNRQEVLEAFENGYGSSTRYSATRMEKTVYEAKRLADGSVLRISQSGATNTSLALGMLPSVCVVVCIAIILSAMLARRMARRIVKPLNALDLEHPLQNQIYEEVSPLLNRISQQHRQIFEQVKRLKRQTDEFEQITRNMKEGLVLVDRNNLVLSINPAAKRLFGVDDSCIGRDFLTVDRTRELSSALADIYWDGRSNVRAERNGREYLFEISRIKSEENVIGGVILALDVTEQTNAERNRREFSANVSHELKTPLQSIIGSAELLENGLVKPEDQPRFVGHIRKEAARLVNLVEDIIRLSQLDEGVELPQEDVDLYDVAEEILQSLEPEAEKRQVTLHLCGGHFTITGVRRLLYEIIYNLSENAIKYNVPGGSVEVSLVKTEGKKVLQVSDTGIGIPEEHLSRIFERFYRVDKSHSKQSGGTGLGLSIVKHAAAYHNGQIDLKSIPGEGTCITVTFP